MENARRFHFFIGSPPDFVITFDRILHHHQIGLAFEQKNGTTRKESFSHRSQVEHGRPLVWKNEIFRNERLPEPYDHPSHGQLCEIDAPDGSTTFLMMVGYGLEFACKGIMGDPQSAEREYREFMLRHGHKFLPDVA